MSDVKLQHFVFESRKWSAKQKSRNLYLSITTYTHKDVSALTRLTPKKISHQKGLNSTLKFRDPKTTFETVPPWPPAPRNWRRKALVHHGATSGECDCAHWAQREAAGGADQES